MPNTKNKSKSYKSTFFNCTNRIFLPK